MTATVMAFLSGSHLMQTGYEENPMFDTWNPWSQGVDITCMQNPALMAMLYREAQSLDQMAEQLGREGEIAIGQQTG